MKKSLLSKMEKNKFSDKLVKYVEENFDENMGVIATSNFIDFIIENIGDQLYNRGIEDSKTLISEGLDELNFNLEELKKYYYYWKF